MGIGVSNWTLARAVSSSGQLGVVSGTALDSVLVRRLQDGDIGGAVRHALAQLPLPGVAGDIVRRYFRPVGRAPSEPYRVLPMYKRSVSPLRQQVTIAANFVEVFLAKEGHRGLVGINLLTKVQMPTLAPTLARKATGRVDGFIVEGATSGGHNAPPRGSLKLTERGEPIYGERDVADLDAMRDLGACRRLHGPARIADRIPIQDRRGALARAAGRLA